MIRSILTIALLALIIAGGYLANNLIQNSGWITYANNEWKIAAHGWDAVLHAWPIALAGVLIGLSIGTLLNFLYSLARDKDHQYAIERLTNRAENAEVRAEKMVSEKMKLADSWLYAAERREHTSLEMLRNADTAFKHAETTMQSAHEEINKQVNLRVGYAEEQASITEQRTKEDAVKIRDLEDELQKIKLKIKEKNRTPPRHLQQNCDSD